MDEENSLEKFLQSMQLIVSDGPKIIHPVGKLEVKLVDDCPHVVGAPLPHGGHAHWGNPEQH